MTNKISLIVPEATGLFFKNAKINFGGIAVQSYMIGKILAEHFPDKPEIMVQTAGPFKRSKLIAKKILVTEHYFSEFHNFLIFAYYLYFPILIKNRLKIEDHTVRSNIITSLSSRTSDIFCIFGATTLTAEVICWRKYHNKKSVFFISSDNDLQERNSPVLSNTEYYKTKGFLHNYSITNADVIIVQTSHQQELCRTLFNRNSSIIRNPLPTNDSNPIALKGAELPDNYILWVGRADEIKRPEIVFEIAKQNRDINFIMVCNLNVTQKLNSIVQGLSENIRFYESVPYNEIDHLFRKAKLFISTSVYEGFPNTFLQAAKFAVPIVTLKADPDGFIEKHYCGFSANGDVVKFQQAIRILYNDNRVRKDCSDNITRYVKKYHNNETIAIQLMDTLNSIPNK